MYYVVVLEYLTNKKSTLIKTRQVTKEEKGMCVWCILTLCNWWWGQRGRWGHVCAAAAPGPAWAARRGVARGAGAVPRGRGPLGVGRPRRRPARRQPRPRRHIPRARWSGAARAPPAPWGPRTRTWPRTRLNRRSNAGARRTAGAAPGRGCRRNWSTRQFWNEN